MSNPVTRVVRNVFRKIGVGVGKPVGPNKFEPGTSGRVAPPANQADHDAQDRARRKARDD